MQLHIVPIYAVYQFDDAASDQALTHRCEELLRNSGFRIGFVYVLFLYFKLRPFVEILNATFPLIHFQFLPFPINLRLLLLIHQKFRHLLTFFERVPLLNIRLIHEQMVAIIPFSLGHVLPRFPVEDLWQFCPPSDLLKMLGELHSELELAVEALGDQCDVNEVLSEGGCVAVWII